MELFLNIFWLLITLGVLGAWCIDRASKRPRKPSEPLQELIVLASALVFVFFAVSPSDDLRATAILADDCAIGHHYSLVWDCGHGSHQNLEQPQMSPAIARSQFLFSANLPFAERALPPTPHVYHGLKEGSLFGRSPPRPFNS